MKQKSLTGFMNEVIEDLCQQERFATAHIYTYALRAFTEFVGGGEIFFGGLNKSSLRRFPAPSGRLCCGAITPSPRTYVRCGQCITVR